MAEAVKRFQGNGAFHPLTCGIDSDHEVLEPVAEEGVVVLYCPRCPYRQVLGVAHLLRIVGVADAPSPWAALGQGDEEQSG